MKIIPARRTENIRYAVRDVILVADEAKQQGLEMLYLNIGDPNPYGFRTPPHIIEATIEALQANHNGYSPSSGIEEALAAIRREAERKDIREVRDVFIGTGASEAIEIALSALVNPGENFLIPYPGYPLYSALLCKLDAEIRPYHLDEDHGWQPDLADIEAKIDDRSRGIVLINPNNPTGSNCGEDTLRQVVELCRRNGMVLFSDEIYDKLLYDGGRHISTGSLCDDVCVLTFNGLSKNYVAPGFRLGWCIVSGPEETCTEYLDAMLKLTRARLCANHPEQYAIQPALEGDQSHLREMNETLRRRAELTDRMLNSIEGISCVRPGGAFYAYPRLEIEEADSDFVRALILETGVVVVPGDGFGQRPGTRHFRVVTLPGDEILEKAYGRLAEFAAARLRR